MPVLELSFASGESSLSVRRFSVREAVSAPFVASVWARSPSPSIDLRGIVGQAASLHVVSGVSFAALGARRWNGVCSHAEQQKAESSGLSTYHFQIVPPLWLLGQRRNYRIFQHASVPEIASFLLGEWAIPFTLHVDAGAYPRLEMRVQYGETDLAFLSRLLEEAGIAYVFPDFGAAGTTLVLADALQDGAPRLPLLTFTDNPNQAAEKEFVAKVKLAHEVRPGAAALRDFDLRRPATPPLGEATKAPSPEDRYEQHSYIPGGSLVEGGKPGDTPIADMKGVARHDPAAARERAERHLAAERTGKIAVAFDTNAPDLWPGVVFSIQGHPHPEIDGARLLATHLVIDGTPDEEWTLSGRAVPADRPYRPPLVTPKPVVRNVECALVVGPPGETIHTDELGRVRLSFPWDRASPGTDDSSSWVRVSQGWAGAGYGMIHLPRIGQEVLVTFLDGNPDMPIVVGRVFNRSVPVPYPLPAEATKSTWKSDSVPGSIGFNEIMLEDKKGDELLSQQAEKNRRALVKNDETMTIVRNREKKVLSEETDTTLRDRTEVTLGDRKQSIDGSRTTSIGKDRGHHVKGVKSERIEAGHEQFVGKDQHLTVKLSKREQVNAPSHLRVQGSRQTQVGGTLSFSAASIQISAGKNAGFHSGDETHFASDKFVGEAPDITVKGPGGFVRIDGGGVTIVGAIVDINAGGGPGSGADIGGAAPEPPKEAPATLPTPILVSETVAASPGSRARTKIGIGEEVMLSYTGGTATWTLSGPGTLIPTSGRTVMFRAGDRNAKPTITATGAPGVASLTFDVVEPSSFFMEQWPGTRTKHTNGRPDCGFLGLVFLLPGDVSFQNIEVRELNSRCVATGFYLIFNNFAHQGDAQAFSQWITVNPPAAGRPSTATLPDNIYSGDSLVGPPFPDGSMVWPITWQFRAGGGAEKSLPETQQSHHVEALTGKCTTSKAGETKVRVPADPTSDFV